MRVSSPNKSDKLAYETFLKFVYEWDCFVLFDAFSFLPQKN